jgi:hypothetical protein
MNRKNLKNNTDLAINVSKLTGLLPDSKILVLDSYIPGLSGDMGGFHLEDFFDAVIAETPEAAATVTRPDFIIYADESPYRNSILFIEELRNFPSSIVCTNYAAVQTFQKLGRQLGIHNVNYLIGPEGPTKVPSAVRGIPCGLCPEGPGVHLALLLGSTQIIYSGTEGIDYEFFVNYAEKKNGPVPTNIVRPARGPVLMSKL